MKHLPSFHKAFGMLLSCPTSKAMNHVFGRLIALASNIPLPSLVLFVSHVEVEHYRRVSTRVFTLRAEADW